MKQGFGELFNVKLFLTIFFLVLKCNYWFGSVFNPSAKYVEKVRHKHRWGSTEVLKYVLK